nr:putative glucose-6-phosphate 1-epimerase [Tanacetum cinerariifolium]
MGDEHLDNISAMESDEVIKSSVEYLVPIPSEPEGIPDTMCDVYLVNNHTPLEAKDHFEIVINSNDDYSFIDDDSLYYENIEYVEASPHDSELVSLESSATSPKSFLEETNTFDNSLPEFENFCFDLEEISSGSTTTHSDISLSEYDSFIFDLSNDQFPPTDRRDFTHEEFADEHAHIISPPVYDFFYFRNLPDPASLGKRPGKAFCYTGFIDQGTCSAYMQFGNHLNPSEMGYPFAFLSFGTLWQHGFARNRLWTLDEDPSPFPVVNSQLHYPEVHPPSEISDEVFHAKEDLMKSIQTFLEEFHCIPLEEKPTILLQAWFKFFAFKHDQPENSNELFLKLLEDLKELAKYKESLENSSNEIATSSSNQEKEELPQDFDICQLIKEECCIKVSEEQKLNMENTILELVKICQEKELFYMHDNVDDLIESTLNSKLLSINSQRLDKKEQEVKNSSISLNNTSQISLVHAIAPILSTEEPEHSFSMGYEHFSTTLVTELDEVAESSIKNLVPIPRECEVTSEDKKSHVESNFVESPSNHDALIDSSQKIDYLEDFSDELAHIDPEIPESGFYFEQEIHLIENLLYDNSSPQPPDEHIAEEERIKREHAEYLTRMEMLFTINTHHRLTVNANTNVKSIPSSLVPIQDNESQREEIDIVTNTDDVLPPGIENEDNSDEEVDVIEELHVDNSISNSANELSDNEESDFDDPSFPRPPLEPPDADFEPDAGDEISVVMIDEPECLNPKDKFDDYYFFMFVNRIFLPDLISSKVFSFLSAESEDTIFDPGIFV